MGSITTVCAAAAPARGGRGDTAALRMLFIPAGGAGRSCTGARGVPCEAAAWVAACSLAMTSAARRAASTG